ncbi:MAG: hypothetical protein HN560_11000 [Anaerolineae bacterium]|jgi:hypothetical protein|nr:hypothetical protein [Anaerolineae bacterium]MBT7988816.1 hypothetical protein [Anaerolineae bacterium]
MKKAVITLIALLSLVACIPNSGQSAEIDEAVLLVTIGDIQETFVLEDLQSLPSEDVSFNGVFYKGVRMSTLLEVVSVNPDTLKALKAVATDGYSVNYDPTQILKDNVLVAYALADGSSLSADDGNYRMVLPDEGGKLNLRMLAELEILQ